MKHRKGSNPSGSTIFVNETLDNKGFRFLSAPKKNASAPNEHRSVYHIEFMVEGPNSKNTEMIHQINCINCNGDVTKRWYVEYYITCTQTNKRIRKREYGFVNREKDPDIRLSLLEKLKFQIIQNIEFQTAKKFDFISNDKNSITYYINLFLSEKRKVLEFETIRTYVKSLKNFHAYLKVKCLTTIPPQAINKQIILDFRNYLTDRKGNRSVNNDVDTVKIFFEYLIKQHENVLLKNPCSNVPKLPSKSESHVAYTKKQAQEISNYLKENDLQMLHYCRFIALGFLRCNETRHLKIGDIDFDKKTITLSAKIGKTHKRTVKPMLQTFYNHLIEMNIKELPPNFYVFTQKNKPGTKITYDNYFQKKYKKVKTHFQLSNKHTIYGFRHTFVCELLDSGASWHEIMKYTGHTTMAAFEKYARSILNKPANDLSDHISINF